MSRYFSRWYPSLRFPIERPPEGGLRNAQLGAIYAVASHFTQHEEPAIVVMPTGSGKTVVLIWTAFMAQAERVLVVTPSVLLRDQIKEEFETLEKMRAIGGIKHGCPGPTVMAVEHRMGDADRWEHVRGADVVIATPYCISPKLTGVEQPPADLFDLLLIDEAHHAPAVTWQGVLTSFPRARRVLTTATPFRQDRKEIPGRVVYSYGVGRAFSDGVFGKVQFVPVKVGMDDDEDTEIARSAERVLQQDRSQGLRHLLMVRVDGRARGRELAEVYRHNTTLRLGVVDSGLSAKQVRDVLESLRAFDLDGVICVNMMGEGFDLPHLKIAAIHAPHKSLAVTLQFVGRFARTNAPDIGAAKFVAVPKQIAGETDALYREDAVWQDIITELSEEKVAREIRDRDRLQRYERAVRTSDSEKLSLRAIEPARHVRVYDTGGQFNLRADLGILAGRPWDVELWDINEQEQVVVLVIRRAAPPDWIRSDVLQQVTYDLFVVYYHAPSKLMFIGATDRADGLYQKVAELFSKEAQRLPQYKLNQVLAGMENAEFFSVGMRNSVLNSNTETYRILAGSNVEGAIRPSDGQRFHRGHVYGGGFRDGERVTIGYSSGSKVWTNGHVPLNKFVEWCAELGCRMARNTVVETNSGLDYLSTGVPVTQMPDNVIAADWNEGDYQEFRQARYFDGIRRLECCLVEMDIAIDHAHSNASTTRLTIKHGAACWPVEFTLQGAPRFRCLTTGDGGMLEVESGVGYVPLDEHLNEWPLSFFLSDMSRVCMNERFGGTEEGPEPFDRGYIQTVDWTAAGVNISVEVPGTGGSGRSIHDYIEERLLEGTAPVVFYDHTRNEVADFLEFDRVGEAIVIRGYHCKPSDAAEPGARVDELYEVVGQAAKCVGRLTNPSKLKKHIEHRSQLGKTPRFVKGNAELLDEVIRHGRRHGFSYEVVVVQPGISKRRLTDGMLRVIAAASDYVAASGAGNLVVLASV